MLALICAALLGAAVEPRQWEVDGLARQGLVFAPEKTTDTGAPVVFVFHGHGGTMESASRTFEIQQLWPEALVVYLQGVPTPSPVDPRGLRSGWQYERGQEMDRDVKLVDAVWKHSGRRKHKVDAKRVYVTGFSNGGGFTYCLWASRPELFAAFAPIGAIGRGDIKTFIP